MLAALATRVQVNGKRLAAFYRELRLAWMDLVLELATDDTGLSLGTQTVVGIISNLLTAPLGPEAGVIVGIIADGIVNVTDEVMSDSEMEQRKKQLRDMMVAPTVTDVGEKQANGRLADLLLDAVGYATWLQAAPLEDLWKFRIPAEFPDVSAERIRFEIARAVIAYRGPALYHYMMEEVYDTTGTYVNGYKYLGDEVLQVRIQYGRESKLEWNMFTHAALHKAIRGHRIGELEAVPLIVEFTASHGGYDPDYETPPRAVFGRNTAGTVVVYDGNFQGLYYLHSYCHPDEEAPTMNDIEPLNEPASQKKLVAATSRIAAYREHFREYAACGAEVLLRDYIDPFVLERRRK